MSDIPGSVNSRGRAFAILGALVTVTAFVYLPMGLIGAVLGGLAYHHGDKRFGLYVMVGALVFTAAMLLFAYPAQQVLTQEP